MFLKILFMKNCNKKYYFIRNIKSENIENKI